MGFQVRAHVPTIGGTKETVAPHVVPLLRYVARRSGRKFDGQCVVCVQRRWIDVKGKGVVAAERGRRGEGQFIDRPGTGGTKIQNKIL